MKKMFIEELPHGGYRLNNKYINWKKSIGYKVEFIYDNIKGEVEIIDYFRKNNYPCLKIKYKNKIYSININDFRNCSLGNILGLVNHNYKYQIGDVINNVASGKLKILEQIKIKGNDGWLRKYYRYKCLICGNIDTISEGNLTINKNGCSVCSGRKVLVGYNDMWTTNSELASLLDDPEDGYRYTQNSNKRVDWKCSNCGNIIKNKVINKINQKGLSCPKCSDGISYPEKFMFNVLQQLKIEFTYQLSKIHFKWCKNYRYDFYFILNNKQYIIEMDGSFHKNDNKMNGQTKKESKAIDDYKDKLAREYDVEVIRIDCQESEINYIKDNIIKSKLNNIFDLSKINWLKCEEFACNSLVKQVCELWNSGICSANKISKIMKIGRHTILGYLKQGAKLDWCDYDPKKVIENKKQKIVCLNDNKIFNSIKESEKFYNIPQLNKHMKECCNNQCNYNHNGINPITGEYLQWQYYDEYLVKPKKLLSNEEIDKLKKKQMGANKQRKIICMNNNRTFNSITEAENYYNIKNISYCCIGKRKSAGKDLVTNEPLHWMYYDEYLQLQEQKSQEII